MDIIKLLPFQNVAATALATCDLKNLIGRVVDRVVLQLGGTSLTKAMLTGVQVKANGKLIYDDTGSRADARQTYRGITANAAFLAVDFSEPRSKTIVGQKLGAIDTLAAGITSLTAEVNIAGATAPTLVGYAMCSTRDTQLRDTAPLIGKTLTFIHPCTATTTKFPLNIPYGRQAGSLIKRLHVFVASGTITINGIEVRKNGVTVHETLDAANDFIQTEYQRTPQSNCYTVDFIVDGNLSDTMNAANANTMEYYADVTVSAGGTLAVVAELLDPLGNN